MTTQTVLKLTVSPRGAASVSNQLLDEVTEKRAGDTGANIITRDVSAGLPFVDQNWIGANFTDPTERTSAQQEVLSLSDELIGEVKAADHLVIGVPVWNFGVPAPLKAWIDLICRARETFANTEAGPKGLLEGKSATLVIASGGTESGSAIDFATGYMKHILGFIGITDVDVVAADRLMVDADAAMAKAHQKIEGLSSLAA